MFFFFKSPFLFSVGLLHSGWRPRGRRAVVGTLRRLAAVDGGGPSPAGGQGRGRSPSGRGSGGSAQTPERAGPGEKHL